MERLRSNRWSSCTFWSVIWPLCRSWGSAGAGLPGADWSGGAGRWCWGISPGLGGSVSSALARPPDESGSSASIEANPRHSARTLTPSDGPSQMLSIVYEMIRYLASAVVEEAFIYEAQCTVSKVSTVNWIFVIYTWIYKKHFTVTTAPCGGTFNYILLGGLKYQNTFYF